VEGVQAASCLPRQTKVSTENDDSQSSGFDLTVEVSFISYPCDGRVETQVRAQGQLFGRKPRHAFLVFLIADDQRL
jgi:hypothetical protein